MSSKKVIWIGATVGSTLNRVGSLSVNASSTITPHAHTLAVSAGIGSSTVNFSFIKVHPEVQAYIGHGATVYATGAVDVDAESSISAQTEMFGVNAGALAVGVSKTDVTVSPTVVAALGNPDNSHSGSVHITAGSLSVHSSTPLIGNTAKAKATNYKACLALEVPAYVAFYKSPPEFLGDDVLTIEVKYAGGRTEIQKITVKVNGPGAQQKI